MFTCYLFNEFSGKDILPDLANSLPFPCQFIIHDPTPTPNNDNLNNIYRTNAKLFFPKDTDSEKVDAMITVFEKYGFTVANRNPYIEKYITITVHKQVADTVTEKCSECGTEKIRPKTICKEQKVLKRYYSNDRVIFTFDNHSRK